MRKVLGTQNTVAAILQRAEVMVKLAITFYRQATGRNDLPPAPGNPVFKEWTTSNVHREYVPK